MIKKDIHFRSVIFMAIDDQLYIIIQKTLGDKI